MDRPKIGSQKWKTASPSVKKVLVIVWSLCLGMFLASLPAVAEEISLTLIADTHVDKEFPDENFGNADLIDVHYGIVGTTPEGGAHYLIRQMMLLFSQEDLMSIPEGATINSAKLQAYLNEGEGNTYVFMDVAFITKGWNEMDVTWNSLSSSYAFPRNPRITSPISKTSGWKEWDVTRIVQYWRNGTFENHGLLLMIYLEPGTPIEDYSRLFYSKERDATLAPRLVVDYTLEAPITDVDLTITNLEITQATQVIDDPTIPTPGVDNSVPLIEDKPTIVRLYVDIGPAASPVHGVTAHLYRVNDSGADYIHPLNPVSAAVAPDRENHLHTINFRLPPEWLQDDMNLYAIINPSTLSMRVPETDYTNNRYPAAEGTFIPISYEGKNRCIDITWLRVNYTWSGWAGSPQAQGRVGHHEAVDFIRTVYPLPSQNVNYYPWPGGGFDWVQDINNNNGGDLRAELNNIYNLSTITPKPDFLYGWIPENSFGIVGLSDPPYNGGAAIVAFGEDKDPNLLYRVIFTHELGHNLNQVGHNNLPNARLTDGEYGYDVLHVDPQDRVVMRSYVDGGAAFNLIDYMRGGTAPAILDGNFAWVTPFTYQGVHAEMTARGISCPPAWFWRADYRTDLRLKDIVKKKYLLVSGVINKDRSGRFRSFYVITDQPRKEHKRKGNYAVELQDREGRIIAAYFFDVKFMIDNYAGKEVTSAPFTMVVPYSEKIGKVVLRCKEKVFDSVEASANPPEVRILSPSRKERLTRPTILKWRAEDADRDPLTYAVLYSRDGGMTWVALVSGLMKTEFLIKPQQLPGSQEGYLRVMASDGLHTAYDDLDQPILIDNKPPKAHIVQPKTKTHFPEGASVLLKGQGYDLEDGVLGDKNLLWISNRDGFLGVGRRVIIKKLSVGMHYIKLIAFDREGNLGTDTVTVYITQPRSHKVKDVKLIKKRK